MLFFVRFGFTSSIFRAIDSCMNKPNLLYAQSGGMTAVINATAASVIQAARARTDRIGRVFAARHGIVGVLREDLVDTSSLGEADLETLLSMPGGVFGSCRLDLDDPADNPAQYDRLFAVFEAHNIGFFLYNGGNGSMDAVAKLSREARRRAYPLVCIGVPKTVDNDIEGSDASPGFGSAAKYVANSMLEAGRDLVSMHSKKGRVFVLEVMGRNAGWLAAATALASNTPDEPPHLILMPEVLLDRERFLEQVRATVERIGYCAVTVSEGIRDSDGQRVMAQPLDNKGHVQLGGAGQGIAHLIQQTLGYRFHWCIPDYLQRSAGHLVSATDHDHACAVGRAAVDYALEGRDAVMPALRRLSDSPYRWDIVPVDVAPIANLERLVPNEFIREDGFHINDAGRRYLRPLIEGERMPRFQGGVAVYPLPTLTALARHLPAWQA